MSVTPEMQDYIDNIHVMYEASEYHNRPAIMRVDKKFCDEAQLTLLIEILRKTYTIWTPYKSDEVLLLLLEDFEIRMPSLNNGQRI